MEDLITKILIITMCSILGSGLIWSIVLDIQIAIMAREMRQQGLYVPPWNLVP